MLDLRWLAPLPLAAVREHAGACRAVLVVDECRATGAGIADALVADLTRARVPVRDRGKGVPAEDLPKLFDSFYSTKPQGMGLGLSIARTIVEAHGGRIFAERNADEGATFTFELPVWTGATVEASGTA